jgi:hypothetical protein
MSEVYNLKTTRDEDAVLDELRKKVSEVAGVTIQGNRLTIRFKMDGALVNIHSAILRITTPAEEREQLRQLNARHELIERKYPDLDAELYFIDEGEWPQ